MEFNNFPLSPDEVIRKLDLTDNGTGGQTGKILRQVRRELEGKNKVQRLEALHQMFPNDPVWSSESVDINQI